MSTPLSPAFAFDGPAVAERLVSLLNEVATSAGSKLAFSAEFIAPEPIIDEVKECFSRNCTLMAKIRLSLNTGSELQEIEIPIPYPYHGVFVMGSGNGKFNRDTHARLMVWHPCLVRRPGLWLLRMHKADGEFEPFAELGLLPDCSISTRTKSKDRASDRGDKKAKTKFKKSKCYRMLLLKSCLTNPLIANQDTCAHVALDELSEFLWNPRHVMLGEKDQEKVRGLLAAVLNDEKITGQLSDDDDLNTKRLYTYGAFVAENLARLISNRLMSEVGEFDVGKWPEIDGAYLGAYVRRRLTPRKGYGWLRLFDSSNAAAAISSLTAFSRYGWPSDILKRLPAAKRQNHPSFKGLVCPVQTPESDHVGLTLNLAVGATADSAGVLTAAQGSNGLGYAASLLPFCQHTDAARAMMGAKNYVQALAVERGEEPLVTTGAEKTVRTLLAPLSEAGLLPQHERFFSPGRNLIVAYMPWFGLNYNDAIVANAFLADDMAFCGIQHCVEYLQPGDQLERRKGCNDESVLCAGTPVKARDRIALVSGSEGRRDIRAGLDGVLMETGAQVPNSAVCGGIVSSSVSKHQFLGIGDKLMGRHGNKGVISVMLPPSQMPRLPVDERLGDLSGKPVDLVLNPLGVISRMNIGQLLESHAGLLLRLGAKGLSPSIGSPFAKADAARILSCLQEVNANKEPVVDACGRMFLTLPGADGQADTITDAPVMVGVQYIVRLNEIPEEKASFRGAFNPPHEYDPVTGQATRGKVSNGGQRLGEMEMWALDAYQAGSLLDHVLTDTCGLQGLKDDEGSQTFRSIRDGLFALGVVIEKAADGYRLRWSTDEEIEHGGHEIRPADGGPPDRKALTGEFRCPHDDCTTESINDLAGSRVYQRDAKTHFLCVEDLFRDKGVKFDAPDYSAGLKISAKGRLSLSVANGSPCFDIFLKKGKSARKSIHASITVGGMCYHAYDGKFKGDVFRLNDLLDMPLCCVKHTSDRLVCTSPKKIVTVTCLGGLSEDGDKADGTCDWGFIRLPKAVKDTEVLRDDFDGRASFGVVPVLPSRYRRGNTLEDGTELPNRLTKLYQRLAHAVKPKADGAPAKSAKRKSDDTRAGIEQKQQDEVLRILKELFTELRKRLIGKDGLIRRHGLGRRVDNSGRFVVVPDPDLLWDECGLPLEMLKRMFSSDKGLQEALQRPEPETESAVTKHLRDNNCLVLVNRPPTLHRYNIKALRPVARKGIKWGLDDYMQAKRFQPNKPLNLGALHVMAINPLACQSMGCDFDGDTLSVHVVRPEDTEESLRLLPTDPGNLLSLASGEPVAGFDQDMVLGTYLISMYPDLRTKTVFNTRVLVDGCAECRQFSDGDLLGAKRCSELLEHLCKGHKDEVAERTRYWMRMAFEAITRKGISFGYFDLLACQSEEVSKLLGKWQGEPVMNVEDRNGELAEVVKKRLREIVDTRNSSEAGFSIAAMALSCARGDKQVRQLVAARGYLEPGESSFVVEPKDFFFPESLVKGMNPDSFFWAAMNGRSTMTDKKLATGKAGHLTRLMVMACWPWRVKEGDCGSEADTRSPATCCWATEKRICTVCYGKLPDGNLAPDGYPAGLIAAQSVGERGTQLSMKGFHTGSTAVDIDVVRARMNDRDLFGSGADPEQFLKVEGKRLDAYANILGRHIHLLWRVISASTERTLNGAVNRECADNMFAGIVGKGQWEFIKAAIGKTFPLHTGGVLARIMIGFAGEKGPQEGHRGHAGPGEIGSIDGGSEDNADSSEVAGKALVADSGIAAAGAEECEDEFADNEFPDDTDEINDHGGELTDSDDGWECDLSDDWGEDETEDVGEGPKMLDAPPEKAIIALVVCERPGQLIQAKEVPALKGLPPPVAGKKKGNPRWGKVYPAVKGLPPPVTSKETVKLRCRVAIPSCRKTDSKLTRLAEKFAAWISENCPELLRGEKVEWKFKEQKGFVDELNNRFRETSNFTESEMSIFVNCTWLFWPDKSLPIRALFNDEDAMELASDGWGKPDKENRLKDFCL